MEGVDRTGTSRALVCTEGLHDAGLRGRRTTRRNAACHGSVEHAGNVSFGVYQVATFAEHNGKTELTLQAFVTRATPESAASLSGMEQGWSQSLDKLDELLART